MEKIKAGAIAVFVIGLLGIILSASWDWIVGNECCMGKSYGHTSQNLRKKKRKRSRRKRRRRKNKKN